MENSAIEKISEELRKKGLCPSITIENDFVKLTNPEGHICYCTQDLERNTGWVTSIEIENGYLKLTRTKENKCLQNWYMTLDLEGKACRDTSFHDLEIQDGYIMIRSDEWSKELVHYYTPDLNEITVGEKDSLKIQDGYVTIKYNRKLVLCTKDLKEIMYGLDSIELENGFVKATDKDGRVCYFTEDLKHNTDWDNFKSISTKNNLIITTSQNNQVRYYSRDFESSTEWADSIELENDFIKLTHSQKGIRYYSKDLKHSTDWGNFTSIKIQNGQIQVTIAITW